MKFTQKNFLENLRSNNGNSITLLLKLNGTACNMRCSYCYSHVSAHPNYAGIEIKHASVSDTIEYLSAFRTYQHVLVVFHGGEPLLTPINDIRAILQYIFQAFQAPKVCVQFQTNGTLINDTWLKLFQEYQPGVSLSFSLDPVETVSKNVDMRFGKAITTRDCVLQNLKKSVQFVQNVGVISVAHRHNMAAFFNFIDDLITWHVPSLTINKLQYAGENPNLHDAYITEAEYVDLLLNVCRHWIEKHRYKQINIQPIQSLFSKNGSKICRYLADEQKCTSFKTFYNKQYHTVFCDHVPDGIIPAYENKCTLCDIFEKCGGGCLLEKKDETFCDARHRLFEFIEAIIPVSKI